MLMSVRFAFLYVGLLFVCLICMTTSLVEFMFIYIAKKTVGFAFMFIDNIFCIVEFKLPWIW